MLSVSDKDAILKIREGKVDYFSYIVNKYTKRIYSFVASKLFEKENADDIVQNAFLHFYKAINRFDENRPVLPYLFEITRNELKMFYRSKKQTVSLDLDVQSAATEDNFFDDTAYDIQGFISTLPSDKKLVVQLVYDGYSYQEIAKRVGKPLNTVKSMIRRLRLEMKQTYEKTNKA